MINRIVATVVACLIACGSQSKPAATVATAPKTADAQPSSEIATQVRAFVEKAAAFVERRGKAQAFAEFSKRNSEWYTGETYVFALDMELNVLLNPAFPENVGTNLRGKPDSNGKLFRDEFLRVVQTKGAGWVDYMMPKPGTTQSVRKWAYVKKAQLDGAPAIGSGFYE